MDDLSQERKEKLVASLNLTLTPHEMSEIRPVGWFVLLCIDEMRNVQKVLLGAHSKQERADAPEDLNDRKKEK
jgi:hypothetical protein